MGSRRQSSGGIADALFTPVQQRVLALLFGQPERTFQSAELISLAESGTGAVHRVLTRLADAGLAEVERVGNQKYYRADKASPVYEELHDLVVKTVAVVSPLREALAGQETKIRAAFVYGSLARGAETAESDVDLLIISDSLTYPDIIGMLEGVEWTLARRVNPTITKSDEWDEKSAETDSFLRRISEAPKLMVLGSEDELT